jgi:cation transport ATPase
VDVSLVEASILVLTLGTGQFLTAALMKWMLDFWDRSFHGRLRLAQQRLLAGYVQRPLRVRIRHGAVDIDLPLAKLRPGHVVVLVAGDPIPADGRVVAGRARFAGLLFGARAAWAQVGDAVRAGSRVLEGEVLVRVECSPEESRAAALLRLVESVTTPASASLAHRGETVARRAVVPTLASAGIALAIGDAGSALAALRPDYSSGPGMSDPAQRLHAVAAWLSAGILVCEARVFDDLAGIDVVLIEERACRNGSAETPPELARLVEELRSAHSLEVGLILDGRCTIEADFRVDGASSDTRFELVARIHALGMRVAFVGSPHRQPDVAARADLVVSLEGAGSGREELADVWVHEGCWPALDRLWELTGELERRRRRNLTHTLIPNAACVAGALLFGFPGLVTLVVTNFAVLRVFAGSLGALRELERRVRRARLDAPASADLPPPRLDVPLLGE